MGVLVGYEAYQRFLAVVEKLEDLEVLVLARKRERALINGEDRLIPMEDVMRECGLAPASQSDAERERMNRSCPALRKIGEEDQSASES